jgi:hypothetical protein
MAMIRSRIIARERLSYARYHGNLKWRFGHKSLKYLFFEKDFPKDHFRAFAQKSGNQDVW